MDEEPVPAQTSVKSAMSTASYGRAPSRHLQQLLAAGGFLAPLLQERTIDGIGIEVQLRNGDEVHLYCGLTRVVSCRPYGNDSVRVEAHKTYASQPCATLLFRPDGLRGDAYLRDAWSVDDPSFTPALDAFLHRVQVGDSHRKEGSIQARWSKVTEPWIVFDKEAQLAYPSKEERERQLSEATSRSVEAARNELCTVARSRRSLPNSRDRWAMPPRRKTWLKVDQLAVDSTGNLVLLEVKDASARAKDVYYAPFQLLQSVWEWYRAPKDVLGSLQKLLDVRMDLGLTPRRAPALAGRLRAAVAFGDDDRSEAVRRRYTEVLGIANPHLPPGVSPMETWSLPEVGEPIRLT